MGSKVLKQAHCKSVYFGW